MNENTKNIYKVTTEIPDSVVIFSKIFA